jgi:hypothetical protein
MNERQWSIVVFNSRPAQLQERSYSYAQSLEPSDVGGLNK